MSDTKVPIAPMADYIVAQPEEAATKTASGLYIPGGAQEKADVVNVVAVGANVKSVKKGDKVVFKGFSQTELKVDGTQFLIIKEEDVIAKVQ